jgi:hypothetical protein
MEGLDSLLPALLEPAGIAAVFALAIWAGTRLGSTWIAANKDIELARVAVTQTLAEALRTQAQTLGEQSLDIRQRIEAQDIVLRRILMSREDSPLTGDAPA